MRDLRKAICPQLFGGGGIQRESAGGRKWGRVIVRAVKTNVAFLLDGKSEYSICTKKFSFIDFCILEIKDQNPDWFVMCAQEEPHGIPNSLPLELILTSYWVQLVSHIVTVSF